MDMQSYRAPKGRSPFDQIRHAEEDGTEWWSVREMMPYLGYERWENMENVIRKAKASCRNVGGQVDSHFRDVTKMGGSRGKPPAKDVQVSRFGAYLIAMNGDPDKREIAAAQSYFVIQTRRAEQDLPPNPAPTAEEFETAIRPWSARLAATIQDHRRAIFRLFGGGAFSTYSATIGDILTIEDELARHQMPLRPGDLPDGSIGQRWSRFRKEQGLPDPVGRAPLWMPHIGFDVQPFVYAADQRGYFEVWLNTVYIPQNMPDYFAHKKEWKELRLPAASAADHASLRLTGAHAVLPAPHRQAIERASGFIPAKRPAR